jgi:hypothetical protein
VQASSTFGQMVGLHFSHDRAVVLGAFTSPQRYAAERCRDVHTSCSVFRSMRFDSVRGRAFAKGGFYGGKGNSRERLGMRCGWPRP